MTSVEKNGIHGTLEFMEIIKPEVLQLLRENRQTRVLAVLSRYMSRKELFNERVEYMDKYFHSERDENLFLRELMKQNSSTL